MVICDTALASVSAPTGAHRVNGTGEVAALSRGCGRRAGRREGATPAPFTAAARLNLADTTDPAHCETARLDVRMAYQAETYIAAGDGQQWIAHMFSPRADVYPDRATEWRCGSDVPC